ncbi:Uncharacterized protein Adt_04150 [Abeliophyllum distichum]|uniref:Uncharacterized protein n=1 Tax=Abeliophyllum distichum TaxID=126358 RepID=A0ABD1W0U0_9LAMI
MKFPTPGGIAKICGNQTEARFCYINALQKAMSHENSLSAVMTIQTELMDVNPKRDEEEMILDEDLDSQIIGSDSLVFPAEKLETFHVNFSDLTQMLQVGMKLDEKMKEEMKQFLKKTSTSSYGNIWTW